MNTVERVKELLKEKGVSVARFERDCGFSNGYIRNIKKGLLPSDKLQTVADYLDVSVEYLLTGEDLKHENYYYDPDARAAAQEVFERPGMRVLFSAARGVSEQDLRTVATILERMKETNPDG